MLHGERTACLFRLYCYYGTLKTFYLSGSGIGPPEATPEALEGQLGPRSSPDCLLTGIWRHKELATKGTRVDALDIAGILE
jgi:hypothetical protein